MKKDTIIFDMDGVLFDTEKIGAMTWERTQSELDIPFDELMDEKIQIIGFNPVDIKEHFLNRFKNITSEKYEEWQKLVYKEFDQIYNYEEIPLKPGGLELLTYLDEKGYKIALASSSIQKYIEILLKRVGYFKFFDNLLGGDKVENGKPHPEIYLKSMEALGKSPKDCIVIEDSYNGIRSAKSAGADVIMVPDMLPPTDEMREKTVAILPSLNHVIDYLKENN